MGGTSVTLSHYDVEADETYTITLTGTGDTVLRIDERLQKKLGMMSALRTAKPRVHDHLQNEHIFVITYIAKTQVGVKTAWDKKREIMEYFQKTGHTWKLAMVDTGRGFSETIYAMCKSVDAPDMAGEIDDMQIIIELVETENWEGQP